VGQPDHLTAMRSTDRSRQVLRCRGGSALAD
jgi:hypothetical protein